MKKVFLAAIIIFLTTTFCLAQQSVRFHHRLSQERLNNNGFQLQRRFTEKDSAITKRVIIGDTLRITYTGNGDTVITKIVNKDTIRVKTFVDRATKINMKLSKITSCILTLDKGVIVADFFKFKDACSNANDPAMVNYYTPLSNLTFVLSDNRNKIGDDTKVLNVPFFGFTWGVGASLIRLRFKSDSSATNAVGGLGITFNIIGPMWGMSKITLRSIINRSYSLNPMIGLSTTELKKETVKTPKTWENEKRFSQTNLVLSYGISNTFARNNFGIQLSMGFDVAVGENVNQWSYQNKFWIGTGVSLNLGLFK
jgi:hypothetical protein